MGRSGYGEDGGNDWSLIRWRGQVASAIRGKRGQAFLHELVQALDAMPEKRLIEGALRHDDQVCALGCVGVKRGVALETLDPCDYETLGDVFGVAHQLIQELEWMNDEAAYNDTPELRWRRVRDWAAQNIKTV